MRDCYGLIGNNNEKYLRKQSASVSVQIPKAVQFSSEIGVENMKLMRARNWSLEYAVSVLLFLQYSEFKNFLQFTWHLNIYCQIRL